jgi:uncharacterized membrane protein YfcA
VSACLTEFADLEIESFVLLAWTLLSSLISSVIGFAYSPIAGTLIFHVVDDHVKAVSILLVSSIALQSYAVVSLRQHFDWRAFFPFLAGGLAGLAPGLVILTSVHPSILLVIIGSLTFGYGLFAATGLKPKLTTTRRRYDMAAGFLGGLTGPIAAFPGAFVTIWCSAKNDDKLKQRAVYQPYILAMQLLSLIAISQIFPAERQISVEHLVYIIPAVIGAALGIAVFRRLSNAQFQRLFGLLLAFAGLTFILEVVGAG